MEITKFEIEEFAETGTPDDLRRYVLTTAQILNKTQLRAMQRYFSRKYQFSVPEGNVATQGNRAAIMTAKEEDDYADDDSEGEDPDTAQLLAEAANEIAADKIQPPKKPAQDFGFGAETPRQRVNRAQAEAEFNEVIKRRPQQ
jgi:hypothetical protein